MMKSKFIKILVACITALFFMAFITDLSKKEIEKAINQGNATDLSRAFQKTVALDIPGFSGNYSKSQTTRIFIGFFKKHPPGSFSFSQEINSGTGKTNLLGYYKSSKGKSFLVKVVVINGSKELIIIEIQFK